jgi:cold shock protein
MNRIKPIFLAFLFMIPFMFACEQGTDVVDSGTYQGTVDEVEADKTEIYVKTDDNKRLELYFNENTTLTRNGETVAFDQLEEGQRVEVQVEKTGQRLDPIAVTILE